MQRLVRVCLVGVVAAAIAEPVASQARPVGGLRPWVEVGFDVGGVPKGECGCGQSIGVGGMSLYGGFGVSLPSGFGIGLSTRRFGEVNFEATRSSRYLLGIGQYAPKAVPPLTIILGVGQGRHEPSGVPQGPARAITPAVMLGLATRTPPSTRGAFVGTVSMIKNFHGSGNYAPTMFAVGAGFNWSFRKYSSDLR